MGYGNQLRAAVVVGVAVVALGSAPLKSLAQTEQQSGTLTATPDSSINIRSGPNTAFAVIHTGVAGDAVTILESHLGESSTWHRVQFEISGAVGWVRADLLLKGGVPVSDLCHGELSAVRGELNAVPEGFLRGIYIGYDEQAPADRPVSIGFVLGGPGQATVLSSPQFMLSLSQAVIEDCNTISSVRFSSDSSGWHGIYGLVDGEVALFACVEPAGYRALEWGEYFCTL